MMLSLFGLLTGVIIGGCGGVLAMGLVQINHPEYELNHKYHSSIQK